MVLEDGWSGREDWGVWAEGTTSRAFWVATEKASSTVQVQVFPSCRQDQHQTVTFEVNGEPLTSHRWNDCEPWPAELAVPASLVRLGRNDLVLRSEYAVRPIDAAMDKAATPFARPGSRVCGLNQSALSNHHDLDRKNRNILGISAVAH
jgi:hypothetical protein